MKLTSHISATGTTGLSMNLMPFGLKELAADFLEMTIECVLVGSKEISHSDPHCSSVARSLFTPSMTGLLYVGHDDSYDKWETYSYL